MTAARLLPEAEEELLAAATFYEAEQAGLGRALLQEVRRTLRLIEEHPLAARIERAEIRVRTVGRFPYRVYYRARRDEILVVAVGHRHRRPGYWRSRVVT
jgi:plasmid stabilization system protein ParE